MGQLEVVPTESDRPSGAVIDQIQDAVQEFLTDWLVRRKYQEALGFLSPGACASVNIDDDYREETLDAARARKELLEIMKYSADKLGEMLDLSQAVEAFPPWDPKVVVLEQPFSSEFAVVRLDQVEAAKYMCKPADSNATEYYGVFFRFQQEGAAVLGLLWGWEENQWRILAYRTFEQ